MLALGCHGIGEASGEVADASGECRLMSRATVVLLLVKLPSRWAWGVGGARVKVCGPRPELASGLDARAIVAGLGGAG